MGHAVPQLFCQASEYPALCKCLPIAFLPRTLVALAQVGCFVKLASSQLLSVSSPLAAHEEAKPNRPELAQGNFSRLDWSSSSICTLAIRVQWIKWRLRKGTWWRYVWKLVNFVAQEKQLLARICRYSTHCRRHRRVHKRIEYRLCRPCPELFQGLQAKWGLCLDLFGLSLLEQNFYKWSHFSKVPHLKLVHHGPLGFHTEKFAPLRSQSFLFGCCNSALFALFPANRYHTAQSSSTHQQLSPISAFCMPAFWSNCQRCQRTGELSHFPRGSNRQTLFWSRKVWGRWFQCHPSLRGNLQI